MLCQDGRYYSQLQPRADDENDYYCLCGMWNHRAINLSVFCLAATSSPISVISNGVPECDHRPIPNESNRYRGWRVSLLQSVSETAK